MSFDPDDFLCKNERVEILPPQLPATILDLERTDDSKYVYDMHQPMADPCPACGGFRMALGDWICWGTCYRCFEAFTEEAT